MTSAIPSAPQSAINTDVSHSNPNSATVDSSSQFLAAPYLKATNDEVSLVDIALVLVKNRHILAIATALFLFFGVLCVMLIPVKYKYAVVLETGSYVLPDEHGNLGERKLIESAGHTKSKLETSIVPQTLLRHPETENERKLPEFTVSVPDGSNLVEISVKAPESKDAVVISLLESVAKQVSVDHKVKSSDVIEALRQRVELMEVKVQELSAKLVEQKQNQRATAMSLERLKDKRALLSKQLERISGEVAQLQESRKLYMQDSSRAKDAMALLLIDNEASQSARQRDELENELFVELASEKAWLEKRYENQSVKVETVSAELGRAKEIFKRFSKKSVDSSNNMLEVGKNIYPTTLAVDPYREREPLGIGLLVKFIIVVLLSIFFGLVITFIAEFVKQVRKADLNEVSTAAS